MARIKTPSGIPQLAKRPESGNWQLRWYDPQRRKVVWRSTGTTDLAEAQVQLVDFFGRESSVAPAASAAHVVTVKAALDEYLNETMAGAPSEQQARIARNHLVAVLGDELATALDVERQQGYVDHRDGKGVRPATISRELSVLRAALFHARHKRPGLDIPRIYDLPATEPRGRWLTKNEFEKLLGACKSEHLRLYMLLGITTLARPEAILDLRWDRIDFEGDLIRLNAVGRAQTAKRRPTIRMTELLKAELVAACERRKTDYVVEYGGYPVLSVKTAFREATAVAGFQRGDVTPYTLRHTGATWMAQDGVPLWEIAGFLGHSDTRMVERHYAHHHPDFQKRAVASLHGRLSEMPITPQLHPRRRKGEGEKGVRKNENPNGVIGKEMVGAARIELATPTMST